MSIKPHSVEKIRIPTDFAEFGRQSETIVNLACCENSCASPMALRALESPAPKLLIEHWNAQDPILRRKLAELHGVKPEQIYVTSGALAGIRHCFDLFVEPRTNVGLCRPDFTGFVHYAQRRKANISWLGKTTYPFTFETEEISDFIRQSGIDFFITSNPSAVTGTQKDKHEIEFFLESNPNTLFVIDEADSIYPNLSAAELSQRYDNVIFLGSFSKFYGLSGLRVGYLITPKDFSEHFDKTIDPIELTSIGILAATNVLNDIDYQRATQERVRRNFSSLEKACSKTPYQVVPGSKCFASYLWAREGTEDPYQTLLRHGIKIAKGETFGLDKGGRVNLSSEENIAKLVSTIRAI